MTEDELTIPDVLADDQKNFCNVLTDDNDENEAVYLLANQFLPRQRF